VGVEIVRVFYNFMDSSQPGSVQALKSPVPHHDAPYSENLSRKGSQASKESTASSKSTSKDNSIKRTEPEALKSFALLSGLNTVSKDRFAEVLKQKTLERESCVSLPSTLMFFAIYMCMVLAHENVYETYRTERAIRDLVEGVTCEGSDFRLSDAAVPLDIWRWLEGSIICPDSAWFVQRDM
jgi:hypothetical protein